MVNWTKVNVPEKSNANLVIVRNIAPNSTEKTVKDFFLFCGQIKEFELQTDDGGVHQVALVNFMRESAAKTAILLSNALIDDSHITVEYYFKDVAPEHKEDTTAPETAQEGKPKTNILAEVLANGYILSDQILEKGYSYDKQYGVSTRVQSYLEQLQNNWKQLDAKYHITDNVTGKATEVDQKYQVQDRAKTAHAQATSKAQEILATPTGQKVSDIANQTFQQVQAIHAEAKRIAAQKKQAASGSSAPAGPVPVGTAPETSTVPNAHATKETEDKPVKM